jgi:hypothetical protein
MGDTEIDPTAHTDEDRITPLVREVEQGILNTIPRYRCAPRQPLLSSPLSQGQSRCAQCIEGDGPTPWEVEPILHAVAA